MSHLIASNDYRAKRLSEVVHSDFCGPITPTSYNGKSHFVTFLDDYSHFSYVYPIASKSEVFERFKEDCALVENQFNVGIRNFHSDNGGEYVNKDVLGFCRNKGI